MQKFILLATAAVAQVQAQGRNWRLALSDPQPTGQLTGCGLDEVGQAMTYYTIDGTNGCQALAGANRPGATHYSFTNSSGISCLKAGCDEECHVCAFYQGNCATFSPTSAPHGSGSGSGHPPNHDALEETLSDQVLTCDTTVSGRTESDGMSYLGNPSPDQLLTLQVATPDAFTLNACTSTFSTVLRVFDLEANELKTCTSCECAVKLEAGEYALLVEGDDQAVATTGAFDVSMQCGGRIGRRMVEVEDHTAPVQFDKCYSSAEDYNGFVTSAFLFRMLEFNSSDSHQIHDRGLCLLEPPTDRANVNSIELHWVGGTCDVASDKTRFQATVRATVIDDNNECERTLGTELFQNINVNVTSGEYDIKIGCDDSKCTNCTINQANVLDRALCLGHKWKIYDTQSFNTCGERPDTPIPEPNPPGPSNTGDGKKKAPVAAIVGSVLGALAVGGGVFFVLRRRKLSRMNAYAVLQDDPAF